jgi:FdhD protein
MTSRISIELIQKCAMLGAPILVAVSVPTAHALRAAEKAGITLAAIARNDGFEVFTHDMRINIGANLHVA